MGETQGWVGARAVRLVAGVAVVLATVAPGASAAAAPGDEWVGAVVRFEPLRPSTTGSSADGGPGHRGAMELRRGGALLVDLRLDDYVRGIQEVPSSWPAAAQRAQAVASRTYAVNRVIAARRAAGWTPDKADLCATEQCQVYTGIQSERRSTGAAWQAAATATSGHVLVHQGQPILAKYSSSNGGRSVSGGTPTLPSVDDPDDAVSPHHRWSQRLDPAALARLLGSSGQVVSAERQGDVAVVAVEEAGARREIRYAARDLYDKVNASSLPRNGLPRVFPSDRYALSLRDGQVVADGNGYGHGIGMGQWGAMGKASRGMDHPAILASYYGPARISALPPGAPGNVRVSLAAVARPSVRAVPTGAAAAGGFRVKVDGRVVAVVAPGPSWGVVDGPRPGTVRVVPPPAFTTIPDVPDEPAPAPAPLSAAAAAAAPANPPALAPPPEAVPEAMPELPALESGPVEQAVAPIAAVAARPPGDAPGPVLAVGLGALVALATTGATAWRGVRRQRRDGDPSVLG